MRLIQALLYWPIRLLVEVLLTMSWLCHLLAHWVDPEIARPPRWSKRGDLMTRQKIMGRDRR
jgi:hypothetical protein